MRQMQAIHNKIIIRAALQRHNTLAVDKRQLLPTIITDTHNKDCQLASQFLVAVAVAVHHCLEQRWQQGLEV